ncbi:hypothetical protein [Scytonema sp. NUACC26]|uniref:hypothetical protein n=1 Tax=Scytonema sp. NUACC26 TaxID=3140176 RepID=UPI0034DB91DE
MVSEPEEQMPLTLSSEQLEQLALIPDPDLRKKIEKSWLESLLSVKRSSVKNNRKRIPPVQYIEGILEADKDLATMLELIVAAAMRLYPEVVQNSNDFYEKFVEYEGIEFIWIISTVVFNKSLGWGKKNMGGRQDELLKTLDNIQYEDDKTEDKKTDALDELPVGEVDNSDNENESGEDESDETDEEEQLDSKKTEPITAKRTKRRT